MKIFCGEAPANPFDDPKWLGNITRLEGLKDGYKYGQRSILSQMKDIDLDAMDSRYRHYRASIDSDEEYISFSQFIKEAK